MLHGVALIVDPVDEARDWGHSKKATATDFTTGSLDKEGYQSICAGFASI